MNTSIPVKDVAREYSIIRYGYLFSNHCCLKINWCCGNAMILPIHSIQTNIITKCVFNEKLQSTKVLKGWVSYTLCTLSTCMSVPFYIKFDTIDPLAAQGFIIWNKNRQLLHVMCRMTTFIIMSMQFDARMSIASYLINFGWY